MKKRNLKTKLLSLVLVFTMCLNLIPQSALASVDDDDSSAAVASDETEIQVEGTNDVGELIAAALTDTEDEQEDAENYITDLTLDGTTATVTYQIAGDSVTADVVVAVYDESTEQMVASGTSSVSSDDHSCSVTLEGSLPDYFVVKAYLLESDTHQPLSPEFVNQTYTEEMQDFLSKTADDFEEERVVNLDDDASTNYLVFSEDTIVVHEEEQASGTNVIIENSDGTYTITDADETFTGLAAGDTFSYQYSDGTILIVKVASVTVDGTTVIITEDADAELSDVFEYVKIESDGENGTMTVDTSEADEGVTYLGEEYVYSDTDDESGISTAAVGLDGSYAFKTSYSYKNDALKGTFSCGFTAKVKLYISSSYQYVSFALDCSIGVSVSLTDKFSLKPLKLGSINIVVIPGVTVGAELAVKLEVSASCTFKAEIKTTVGAAYDSDTGFANLSTKPTVSIKVESEIKIFVGFELSPDVSFLHRKIATLRLPCTAGAEVSMTATAINTSSTSKIHTCVFCFDGSIDGVVTCAGEVSLLNGVIEGSVTFAKFSAKLCDFYYSVDHDEWGFGTTCPYISYKCIVTVTDANGNPVSGATISGTGLDEVPVTKDDGTAVFYLANGSYQLKVSDGTYSATKSITIKDNKKDVKVSLTGTTGGEDSEEAESEDEYGDVIETEEEVESDTESETESEVEIIAEGTCGSYLTWTLYEEGTLTISGTGAMTSWSSYRSVPWYDYRSDIIAVVIESGVTSIGNYAFYGCSVLTNVTITESVASIGSFAFYHCSGLMGVTIPEGVTSIKNFAFYYCSGLTEVAIPESVTSIESAAFMDCKSLESITIPEGLISIGDSAFADCSSLISVIIPDSVKSIGEHAFHCCSGLIYISIPEKVTIIGDYAFCSCSGLTSVMIADSVTSIGDSAFYGCSSLSDVYYTGTEDDWVNIEIGSDNSYLTSATIHYNYTSSEEVTIISDDAEAESEADVAYDAELELYLDLTEDETEDESSPETESEALLIEDSSEEEAETSADMPDETEIISSAMLADTAALKTMMAYATGSESIADGKYYAEFTDLVAGEEYVLLVVKSASSDLLAADNLLYIEQETADSAGSVTFAYVPLEAVDNMVVCAYGMSVQSLADAEITLEADSYEYTGAAYKPSVTVSYNGMELEEDTDFTVAYSDNVEAGTASVTLKGRGDYSGTVIKEFVITEIDISVASISLSESSYTYDGTEKKPAITVTDGSVVLEEDTDYTVSYSNNINAGTASVKVEGIGNYTGTITQYFTISKASQSLTASAAASSIVAGKTAQMTVSGAVGTVTYSSGDTSVATVNSSGLITGVKAGTATIAVSATGDDNYNSASTQVKITVTAAAATTTTTAVKKNQTVTASASSTTFDAGTTAQITAGGKGTITYSSSNTAVATVSGTGLITGVKPGTATITVSAAGDSTYDAASKTLSVTITLASGEISSLTNVTSGIKVKWSEIAGATGYYVYRKTSSAKKYTLIRTITGGSMVSYTDTKVKSKNGTTYLYKVVPYSGSTVGTGAAKTTVRLTAVKLSSVKNTASKKITVKWKKTTNVTGYQIQYSTSKTFKSGNKTVKVSGAKKVSRVISKLKKNKTYYVRIRTYKTVNGKTYYSAWSSKKTVKVKK